MTMSNPKILLLGATGYIGGSVLTRLISSDGVHGTITLLVRGRDRIAKLQQAYGSRIDAVEYEGNDAADTLEAYAAQHDIAINAGHHTPSPVALVRGLARRKAATGRDAWFIHESGTSNLADQPVSGNYVDREGGLEFDDLGDDIFAYESLREAKFAYDQRSVELQIVEAGVASGVKTLIVMAPTVFGRGSGLFNKVSIQVPVYARAALAHGHGVVAGNGTGVWDHVHVADLADLYYLLIRHIQEQGGKMLTSEYRGMLFAANGRHTWYEVAQGVVDAAYRRAALQSRWVERMSLTDASKVLSPHLYGVEEMVIELALSSNARTVASAARRLGWQPTRGVAAWEAGFEEEIDAAIAAESKR